MKENTNFALIVVGVVAVVAVIGLLNIDNISGKATSSQSRSVINTDTGNIYYCSAADCKDSCGKECIGVKTRAGAQESIVYCSHNLFYDSQGTYYMYYFCG